MPVLIIAIVMGISVIGADAVANPPGWTHSGPDPKPQRAPLRRSTAPEISTIFGGLKTMIQGRKTFRFDTFGDEAFWSDQLELHEAIAGAANGGVGPGLDPKTALQLGLKVDVHALPIALRRQLKRGKVDLTDPATTLELLRLNAIVGLQGEVASGELKSVGITCALCHSTVDDSFAPGIGQRLDGWAAGDLDVGAIIALAPDLQPFVDLLGLVVPSIDEATVRTVLRSWGPGKFDAQLLLDGKAFRPDGKPAATLIPSIFGLAGVNLHTWTGWGSVSHWNALVANIEMGGQGTFVDSRLEDQARFPIAAMAGLDEIRREPDRVTKKLPELHLYQLALTPPEPPAGSFDRAAAKRGEKLFNGDADCARCHVPPIFTEPGWNAHTPDEVGIDAFQANRSPDGVYRTSPLRGLWVRGDRGYYHDGRFETLRAVINHYDETFALNLVEREKRDLIEYLKSL